MSARELVKAFYNSDLANDSGVVPKFFHKDCELHWTSSQGFKLLNYNDIVHFFEGTRKSFTNLRFEFTHFVEAHTSVFTRHTLFGSTIENPDNDTALGHFSTIWEVKNDKLFRGYEISQQADESDLKSMNSYSRIKI